ncbi:MAG: EF-P lysine aminoacylase GenX [Gammaproteobacteria bacterium]|nr:EF-P lysine aminoacylase GenX [Gammaproteobacteria bacterium]
MSWEPQATLDALSTRAEVNAKIRAFFQSHNVIEVETPILNQYAVTDLHIDSIATDNYKILHTSPEYAMKRLLAFHKCDIYQLCKVFRANEKSSYHNDEFTMLEWYRVAWSYKDLMKEVAELVTTLVGNNLEPLDVTYISYQQIFKKYAGIDIQTSNQADYLQVCGDHSLKLNSALTTHQYQNLILDQIIVPKLEKRRITFVYDFPVEQAALAKLNDQGCAERFELYFGGVELANGFQELTDAQEQLSRFEEDNRQRLLVGKKAIEIDIEFLLALKSGLPESAGVAFGIDRLLMVMLDVGDIKSVLSFP